MEHRRAGLFAFAFLLVVAVATLVGQLGWLNQGAAASNVAVTLTSSDDATSSADDALEVEAITFDEAQTAIDELPTNGASLTLPTTVRGFLDLGISSADIESDPDAASIAVTGTADSILGLTFPEAIEVLVLVDWDEDDDEDDEPRMVISGQFAAGTIGDLIGTNESSLLSDLTVPVGAVTVTNRQDTTIKTEDEELLDPSDFPSNAQAFFERIDGNNLRGELPLRGLVNFQGTLPVGGLDPVIDDALGLSSDARVSFDGSVAIAPEDFPRGGASAITGLSIQAGVPTAVLPVQVRDALGIAEDAGGATFEIAVANGGTPDDTSDDVLRGAFGFEAELSDPLPEVTTTIEAELIAEAGGATLSLSAGVQGWSQPFGIEWLEFDELVLAGVAEQGPGGETQVTVSLDAEAQVGGKEVTASISGSLGSNFSGSVELALNDSVEFGELLTALDVDTSGVPEHVQAGSFGPGTFSLNVTKTGGGFDVAVAVASDLEFFVSQANLASGNSFPSTVLLGFESSANANLTVGIRPNGVVNLSSIVSGVAQGSPGDLTLVGPDTNFGFVLSSNNRTTAFDDLTAAEQQFYEPLLDGDDLEVQAGLNLIGRIDLPEELAETLNESLGLSKTVEVSGSLSPNGASLRLALELDPTKTPDWINSGELFLEAEAGSGGISFELGGSLTVQFRSGLDAGAAAELSAIGIDVFVDEPNPPACPAGAEMQTVVTSTGQEMRCYDLLTFSASATISLSASGAEFTVDLGVEGGTPENPGWQPFGLEWLSIEELRLQVGVELKPTNPPPGLAISIGMSGRVVLGDTDLTLAGKLSVTPVPYPPFAVIKPNGFRFHTSAGLNLDDFLGIQNALATTGAQALGQAPPAPLNAEALGIPNIGLRNVELSFSLEGDDKLCLPQGVFISADIYFDASPDIPRTDRCIDNGDDPGTVDDSSCLNNKDNGCVAGGRIAMSGDGFKLLAEVPAFDLGGLEFQDSVLDMELSADNQHVKLSGGVNLQPVGQGEMQLSLTRVGAGVQGSFVGKAQLGPAGSPLLTGFVDGSGSFDFANVKNSGVQLRVIIDGENLGLEQLIQNFEAEAVTSIDAATEVALQLGAEISAEVTAFNDDPLAWGRTQLVAAGASAEELAVFDEAVNFINSLGLDPAELTLALEDLVLRGVTPPFDVFPPQEPNVCRRPHLEEVSGSSRCWITRPIPLVGPVATPDCTLTPATPSPVANRCFESPALPPWEIAQVIHSGDPSCDGFIFDVFAQAPGCYNIAPESLSPSGGAIAASYSCPPGEFVDSNDQRCYEQLGDPFAGVPKGPGCRYLFFEPGFYPPNQDGLCVRQIPPIPAACAFFQVPDPTNCTLDQFIEKVVLDGSNLTRLAVEELSTIGTTFASSFPVECAEFNLQVNGTNQNADIRLTADNGDGTFSSATFGWDFQQTIVSNLSELTDALRAGNADPCPEIMFDPLAAPIIGEQGGQLLADPPILNADDVDLIQGQQIVFDPFANDEDADLAVLTDVTVPNGFVLAQISPDKRSIIFTDISRDTSVELGAGDVELSGFTYTAANPSGQSASGSGQILIFGVNDPPVTVDDAVELDLRVDEISTTNVLSNDFDPDPTSIELVSVQLNATLGCPAVISATEVEVTNFSCATGAPVYEFLGEGEVLVEQLGYTVRDFEGLETDGVVFVTVIGQNEAPTIVEASLSTTVASVGSTVTLTGTIFDADKDGNVAVFIGWGDASDQEVVVLPPGATQFQATHTYTEPGAYTTRLAVDDQFTDQPFQDGPSIRVRDGSVLSVSALNADEDADNYAVSVDCDDNDQAINPGAVDIPEDGIDQNCNGRDATVRTTVDPTPTPTVSPTPTTTPEPATCQGLMVTIDMNTNGGDGLGTAGDDVILGTPGDDLIDGLAGDDTVCAGDGDDIVIGGDGADRLFGEGGRDILRGNTGADVVDGGDGNDRVLGGTGDDTMSGGTGNDFLGGFGGNDTIDGGFGNETIFGGFGADTISGGPGDDIIRGLIGDDIINGDAGNDNLEGDRGNDTINGGSGDDFINGGNANDILNGNGGDDSVNGGRADDQLSGGGGTGDICVGNKEIVADTADATCESIFGVP